MTKPTSVEIYHSVIHSPTFIEIVRQLQNTYTRGFEGQHENLPWVLSQVAKALTQIVKGIPEVCRCSQCLRSIAWEVVSNHFTDGRPLTLGESWEESIHGCEAFPEHCLESLTTQRLNYEETVRPLIGILNESLQERIG